MEHAFWHQRWDNDQIGFHQPAPHPMLVESFATCFGDAPLRVFLPLCGKTRDIGWLMKQGHHVLGAELSEKAVDALFHEIGIAPQITKRGPLKLYAAENVDIFVGDIFALTREMLGAVDVIYDRAALVALPNNLRAEYSRHLTDITQTTPQFLITFDYDQSQMDGPPFSVDQTEVLRHYETTYGVTLIKRAEVKGGLKGRCPALEEAWLLQRRTSD